MKNRTTHFISSINGIVNRSTKSVFCQIFEQHRELSRRTGVYWISARPRLLTHELGARGLWYPGHMSVSHLLITWCNLRSHNQAPSGKSGLSSSTSGPMPYPLSLQTLSTSQALLFQPLHETCPTPSLPSMRPCAHPVGSNCTLFAFNTVKNNILYGNTRESLKVNTEPQGFI